MDIYLHIGSGKTGTSSIQNLLSVNRDTLAARGYLYPQSPGRERHTRMGFYGRNDASLQRMPNWPRFGKGTPDEFRERFAQEFVTELSECGLDRVILSDEGMYGLKPVEIERLRALLERVADNVHVIVYLRRQDDHLISRYQQVVKTGETRTLAEHVEVDLSETYDYLKRLNRWADRLQPTSFTVRRFERGSFVGGDLIHDFLSLVGLDDALDELESPPPGVNASLDADAVKFLRLWNLKRVKFNDATPGNMNNRRHIPVLSELSTGPVLTLPEDVLDRWMAQWDEVNQAVARDYLGDESGVLFRDPRRTRNVTTDPRLSARARERILCRFDVPLRAKNQLRELTEQQ